MSNTISSITRGPRQSNIELLRILAMFLVLVVHADFWALGGPSAEEFASTPLNAWTRTLIESIAIVCVNVFILISGWFGIRPSVKGLANFLFQCLFFFFGIYAVMLLTGLTHFSIKGLAQCFCMLPVNWFIKAYVGLYILSPVLNAFIENASRWQMASTLIAFYIFQTIWGWSGAAPFFLNGYSTTSFIGLYLLARYVKIFEYERVSKWGGVLYLVSIVANTLFYYVKIRFHIPIDVYAYINPLVVIGALGLLLWFSRLNVGTSKTVNWVAASAFAAFLLHCNPNLGTPIFKPYIQEVYTRFSGIESLGLIFISLVAIFMVAVVLDQPRKWLWRRIDKKFFK